MGRLDWDRSLTAVVLALGIGASIAFNPFDSSPWLLVVSLAGVFLIPVAITRPDYLLYGGLALVSFDRFLAMEVGPLTLKPSHLLFGYALVGAVAVRVWRRQPRMFEEVPRPLIVATLALITLYALAMALSARPLVGARELLVIAGGSIVPAVAILGTTTSPQRLLNALRFFILGQFVVALYGLYEFGATYLGLPTVAPYYGAVGSVSRVTAFSFEPGYYAAYVITALPLILSDIRRHQQRLGKMAPPVLIGIVVFLALFLTNSRAAYVSLPLVFLGLWVLRWSRTRTHSDVRAKRSIVVPILAVFLLMGLAASAVGFDLLGFTRERVASITNPAEPTSNAPRIALYRATARIIGSHPGIGVGPGMLGYILPSYGVPVAPSQEHFATANNIWLEGAAEAGLAALPLIALLLFATLYLVFRRSSVEARALALGALVFLLVHGALVSFLWDMKFWVVLALSLAAHRFLRERESFARV